MACQGRDRHRRRFRQPPKSNETVRVKPGNVRLLHSAVAEQRMSLIVNFMKGDFATPGSATIWPANAAHFDSGESVMSLAMIFTTLQTFQRENSRQPSVSAKTSSCRSSILLATSPSLLFGFHASRLKPRPVRRQSPQLLLLDGDQYSLREDADGENLHAQGRPVGQDQDVGDRAAPGEGGIAWRINVRPAKPAFSRGAARHDRTLASYNIQTGASIHLMP